MINKNIYKIININRSDFKRDFIIYNLAFITLIIKKRVVLTRLYKMSNNSSILI